MEFHCGKKAQPNVLWHFVQTREKRLLEMGIFLVYAGRYILSQGLRAAFSLVAYQIRVRSFYY
jgi:hypothetical protein